MLKRVLIAIIGITFSINGFPAISVTAPASNVTVKAAEDYATAAFQDPWDMNERTDLGWYLWDVSSGSKSNLKSINFSGGIFSATSSSKDPNIYILESAVKGTSFLGKVGANYKINASKYKIFAIRMKLSTAHDALLYWSKNTIYNDISRSGTFSVSSGWNIYIVNIPNLGSYKVLGTKTSWSGNKDSFRFDPVAANGVDIDIDWIRLVENNGSLYRTVKWTGNSGKVDIYLDNDKNAGNGTLGKVASGVSGTSYSLYVGALAPGTYYVAVKNSSGGALSYSTGKYTVNDIPTLQFTSPSEEGGSDFAATVMGNAWDMNAKSDVDLTYRVNNLSISNVSAENPAGDSLGSISLLKGTSQARSPYGDPVLYLMTWWNNGRGLTYPIDSDKYRILVLKMSLAGAFDYPNGSHARVMWKVKGEGDKLNVSEDVIIRHKTGSKVVMNTVIVDLNDLPLEPGASSPSHTGWSGMIEGFRIDPHEFGPATQFYIESIKLAAYERADDSFTIQWNHTDSDADLSSGAADDPYQPMAASTLALYYDTNNSGYNGTLIASGLNPSSGQYTWNTSGRSAGTYYIYGIVSDGLNTNRSYARWPIVIDHSVAASPTISLSKTSLSFSSGGSTSQTFNISNSGGGTLSWSVSDNKSWLSVTPTSGTNSGTVTVKVNTSGLSAGTYTGTVTVSASGATNSPRTVSVSLTVSGGGGGGTPTIKLNRSNLYFGARGSFTTKGQNILIGNSGTGTLQWNVTDNKSWLNVSPTSGTGNGVITVSANKSGLSNGTYTGTVSVNSPNANNSPQKIGVTFKVFGSSGKPYGVFSTPVHGTTARSSIPVTGWVLDDIEVTNVKIYNGSNYVGDAVFVDGSRPDVEQANPGVPLNYRAGWGYMMLTNFLPLGGNGKYTFSARATDKEGNVVVLGSKRVTIDNKNAVKPFGAIDTPAQGGTASGSKFLNWGWALTPMPNKIPTNGSTIYVWVDGVKLGHPTYNIYRSDIAGLFPSYANSNGAVGYYYLNTTPYENGVHTIQWTVKDNANNSDGVGSRYFTIQNTGADARQAAVSASLPVNRPPRAFIEQMLPVIPSDSTGPVLFKKGYDPNAEAQTLYPGDDGEITLELQHPDRLALQLEDLLEPGSPTTAGTGAYYTGYQLVGDEYRELPVGTTIDQSTGTFYWQPGFAHQGTFQLVFIKAGQQEWWKKKITIMLSSE
jgi:hypothetical protein